MEKNALKKVAEICKNFGYGGIVDDNNIESIVIALAENHTETHSDNFPAELDKITHEAGNYWIMANNHGKDDSFYRDCLKNAESLYDLVDSIIAPLGMTTDQGVGLHPTYQVTIGGQEYTEYTALNAMRRYNHYWDN